MMKGYLKYFLIVITVLLIDACSQKEDEFVSAVTDPWLSVDVDVIPERYLIPDILTEVRLSLDYKVSNVQDARIKVGFNDTDPNSIRFIIDTAAVFLNGELNLKFNIHPRYYENTPFIMKTIIMGVDTINNIEIVKEDVHDFQIDDLSTLRVLSFEPDTLSYNFNASIKTTVLYRRSKTVPISGIKAFMAYSDSTVGSRIFFERNISYRKNVDTIDLVFTIPMEYYVLDRSNSIVMYLYGRKSNENTTKTLAHFKKGIYFVENYVLD